MKSIFNIIKSWWLFPEQLRTYNLRTLRVVNQLNNAIKTMSDIRQVLSMTEVKKIDRLSKIHQLCLEFDEQYEKIDKEHKRSNDL